ncbi:MAG: hypothetical protein A2Y33_07200 [Spirochaetes bacterium GWF1_51_8]|nr:MAG: hypothetical protein A2Y33_07200 [Spirochaetes bacterium GWF1_51_8]
MIGFHVFILDAALTLSFFGHILSKRIKGIHLKLVKVSVFLFLLFIAGCGGPVVPIYKTFAELIPSDVMGEDYFGNYIALSGNGDVLAAGVPMEDHGTYTNRGYVFIYSWDGAAEG